MKNIYRILLVVMVLAALLTACGGTQPAVEEPVVEEPAVEEEVAVEEAPAEEEMAEEEPAAEEEMAEEEMAEEEPAGEPQRLILATTTSTYDSGLLDFILPDFEEKYGVEVEVVAVGTGQALALGESGDADVLLVHARAREDAFVEAGNGVARYDVMYNDFVIVGPADDPAGIKGMENAAEALATIADNGATFVSRGDDSGTHTKEKAIWAEAGIEPAGDWYQAAGQGMGAVLTMSDEQQAYTISDRATYLARQSEGLTLEVLVEGDPILFNPYGVIPVNPDVHPNVNFEMAQNFVDWLTSVETQEMIGSYERNGSPLFTPDSEQWRANQ